jgi:hypothetical protein
MTDTVSGEGLYYTDLEIARLLGISLRRLRNKLSDGSPLPPRIQPPGCRTRLWPRSGVHAWLEQFTVTAAKRMPAQPPRHRGRPTKQAARARRS